MASPAQRPLLHSAPVSEFGDLHESADFRDPFVMDRDQTYVPGFSELRRERDLALGRYAAGEIPASAVPTLPANLHWTRAQNKAGTPDASKQFTNARKGYRLVTKDDVGQPWLRERPPGAQEFPDGTIRNGDTVLMVADQQAAARSAAVKARAVDQRLTGVQHTFAQRMEQEIGGQKAQKSAPTITKESGKK